MQLQFLAPMLLLLLLVARRVCAESADEQAPAKQPADAAKVAVPQFPSLFSGLSMALGRTRVKIVSEMLAENMNYHTAEQYFDLATGKSASVISNHQDGKQILYSDPDFGRVFKYRAYMCTSFGPSEPIFHDLRDIQHQYRVPGDTTGKLVPLFGVAALWLKASASQLSYRLADDDIYSVAKDTKIKAHIFEFVEPQSSQLVSFHFSELAPSLLPSLLQAEMALEMIQLRPASGGQQNQATATINVMGVEYDSDAAEFENMLNLPIGFGCQADLMKLPQFKQLDEKQDDFLAKFVFQQSFLELEITGTNRRQSSGPTSSTLYLEMAHSTSSPQFVSMFRIRSDKEDRKVITDFAMKTIYEIDLLQGSCQLRHAHEDYDDIHLDFGVEGLTIAHARLSLMAILSSLDFSGQPFRLMRVTRLQEANYFYYEKDGPWPLVDENGEQQHSKDKMARVVKTFVQSKSDGANDDFGDIARTRLESVTIWIFDEGPNYGRIAQSYRINVMDERRLSGWPEVAETFDVSEECYLKNDQMVEGRDYVWLRALYPISSKSSNALIQHESETKSMIYSHVTQADELAPFRMPRFELMFEDQGMAAEFLLLDIPSVHLIFEPHENYRLRYDNQRDQLIVAPNVEHCAHVCQLSKCMVMSYCRQLFSCYLRSSRAAGIVTSANKDEVLEQMAGCTSYTEPIDFDGGVLSKFHLHNIVSRMQHETFDGLAVPKVPSELMMPREESGLDDDALSEIESDYRSRFEKYVGSDLRMFAKFSLLFKINSHFHVLTPSEFTIYDEDPLSKFADSVDPMAVNSDESFLIDKYNHAENLPTFHEGLPMFRYNALADKQETAGLQFRTFNGLNYDQCALACLDTKCGSFSFCNNRAECTISSIVSSNQVSRGRGQVIVADSDCLIAYRDFARNFQKFQNVLRPTIYEKQTKNHLTPSDCAFNCVNETKFGCYSFEFCAGSKPKEGGSCYYQSSRNYMTQLIPTTNAPKGEQQETGCDHYERSALADYLHVPYRKIDETQMTNFRTSLYTEYSLHQCSEVCTNLEADCSAFQFCLNFDEQMKNLRQECMVVAADHTQDETTIIDESQGDAVIKSNKYLVNDANCHVYALRKDSSQAQLRDLALGQMITREDYNKMEAEKKQSKGGMSLGGCFMLCLTVGLVSMALGFGAFVLKEKNDYVREKYERACVLLGR